MNDLSVWLDVLLADAWRDFFLLWLALSLWVLLIIVRPPLTIVLNKAATGRLSISRHALNRLVEACAEQLKGVVHARAHIRRSGGKFHTTIHLRVRPTAKLDAIQGYLTQEVGDIFKENLGLPDAAGRVEVKVTGVVPEPKGF